MTEAHIFIIPVLTVGKIVLVASTGVFLSRFFSEPVKSISGFTFISVRILLPCLLFANLCLEVTWGTLATYYWGVILSCLPMILGYSISLLFRYVLDREWHGVLTLGCTFQNGLLYPLTVIVNLKGIDWLKEEGSLDAQRMMFMYNILPSCGLWAIGETIIRLARQNLDAERASAAAAVSVPVLSQEMTTTRAEETNEHMESSNISISSNSTPPPQPPPPPVTTNQRANQMKGCWRTLKRALMTPPVACSFLAIAISLIYPLRWVMELPPGRVLLGGLKAVGAGCVPVQLLILGCSLTAKRESTSTTNNGATASNSETTIQVDHVNTQNNGVGEIDVVVVNEAERSCLEKIKKLCAHLHQAMLFTILTCFLRLIVVPVASFAIVHIMYISHLLPANRPFFIALLIGITSPSAVNASLICSLYNYHAKEYARMVFTMYVTAIFTGTAWLIVALWYVERFVPVSASEAVEQKIFLLV